MATANQEIKALRQEVKNLAKVVETNAREVGNGHTNWHLNSEDIKAAAHRAGSNVRSFVATQGERATELRNQTEASIQAHPFRSVALGAAAGLILGAILRRR